MTYDATAQTLAIKVIGSVESNLNYSSINYNDPITVGFIQWYGTRAAALLDRIRAENSASWSGVPTSLTTDLTSHASSDDGFWSTRYLNHAEGAAVAVVLNNNKAIQNNQAIADLAAYLTAAHAAGMDENANTPAVLFFFVMYNQSPRRALAVIAGSGPDASIDRLLAAALNESVLGQYKTRYNTAYNIITSGDTSGIDTTPGTVPATNDGGDPGKSGGVISAVGANSYVSVVGNNLHIRLTSGGTVVCYPIGPDRFTPANSGGVGSPVPALPANPTPTTPGGGTATQAALVTFVTSLVGRYAYSQGATRLTPEKNLYTDCSGLMYYVFQHVAGINIGTFTGNQYTNGVDVEHGSGSVDQSKLQPGDCIYFDWTGGRDTVDHVEMWIGSGNICGHGGPGSGPTIKALAGRDTHAVKWYVRRFV